MVDASKLLFPPFDHGAAVKKLVWQKMLGIREILKKSPSRIPVIVSGAIEANLFQTERKLLLSYSVNGVKNWTAG